MYLGADSGSYSRIQMRSDAQVNSVDHRRDKTRAVLTIAVGKPIYLAMALNLARSFFWWNGKSGIRFFLATDQAPKLPQDLAGAIELIHLEAGAFGTGFSPKLYLDKMAPADETLFIDADCLCVAPLGPVFDTFIGCEVSVVGREESEGELFGDIAARCRAVGVKAVPRFCGGLYFLRKGLVTQRVFDSARQFAERYDELGLKRLRGVSNEEPLIGLAMALHDQHPIPEDGTIKAEPMFFSGRADVDVLKGRAKLTNLPAQPSPAPEWKMPTSARPRVVHFNSSFAEKPPYTTEVLRLQKIAEQRWPIFLASTYASIVRTLPFAVAEFVKTKLRPLYRRFFGVRKVRPSKRI